MSDTKEAFLKWCEEINTEPTRQYEIIFEAGYHAARNNPLYSFQFRLGQFVEDKYTKFQGMIRARTEYVTGCRKYLIQPRTSGNSSLPEFEWFDEIELRGLDEEDFKYNE